VSEPRREALLQVAIGVLARKGLFEATTRQIAHEASVNVATLHYHFSGKDRLIAAVSLALHSRHAAAVASALSPSATKDLTPRGRLDTVWDALSGEPGLQTLRLELAVYHLRRGEKHLLVERVEALELLLRARVRIT